MAGNGLASVRSPEGTEVEASATAATQPFSGLRSGDAEDAGDHSMLHDDGAKLLWWGLRKLEGGSQLAQTMSGRLLGLGLLECGRQDHLHPQQLQAGRGWLGGFTLDPSRREAAAVGLHPAEAEEEQDTVYGKEGSFPAWGRQLALINEGRDTHQGWAFPDGKKNFNFEIRVIQDAGSIGEEAPHCGAIQGGAAIGAGNDATHGEFSVGPFLDNLEVGAS